MVTAGKTVLAHITKNPKVCGGSACVDNNRIRVIDIVQAHSEGYTAEQIQNLFALRLTLAQVYSALAYEDDHRLEIVAEYAAQEKAFEEGVRAQEEYLRKLSRPK